MPSSTVPVAPGPPAVDPPVADPPKAPVRAPSLAWADLAVAAAACIAAAAATMWMPAGLPRAILAFSVLAIAPGYLLIQAVLVPARPVADRLGHCAYALGVSPAYLGLVALTTVFSPNGFRPKAIVAVTLVASLALAAAALARRSAALRQRPAAPTSEPARRREVYAVSDGRSAPRRLATADAHPRPLRNPATTLAHAAAMPKTAVPSGRPWQSTLPKPSAGPSSPSASRSTLAPSVASSSAPRRRPSTSAPSRPLPSASSSGRSRSR
jgi:hypothetical protein